MISTDVEEHRRLCPEFLIRDLAIVKTSRRTKTNVIKKKEIPNKDKFGNGSVAYVLKMYVSGYHPWGNVERPRTLRQL